MKHYISPSGELFAYEADGSQDDLIPSNFVPATAAQISAAQNPQVSEREAALAKIAELELSTLMPRPIRELMLMFAESNNLTGLSSYAKLKLVDEQVAALRNKL